MSGLHNNVAVEAHRSDDVTDELPTGANRVDLLRVTHRDLLFFCSEFHKPATAFYPGNQLAYDKDNTPRNRASKSMDLGEYERAHTLFIKEAERP